MSKHDNAGEAIRQAGYAIKAQAQAQLAVADALILIAAAILGADPDEGKNAQGGAADPPKVQGEAVARGRGRAASPPPPAALATAPAAAAPKALDFDKDVKPLVLQLHQRNVETLGAQEAVKFGQALLARYGADSFNPKPGRRHVDPSQFPKLVDEVKRILAGEDTGVLGGADDNALGL